MGSVRPELRVIPPMTTARRAIRENLAYVGNIPLSTGLIAVPVDEKSVACTRSVKASSPSYQCDGVPPRSSQTENLRAGRGLKRSWKITPKNY